MKKISIIVIAIIIAIGCSISFAGETVRAADGAKPKVAIIYVNNAKTTFDESMDKWILDNLHRVISFNTYEVIDSKPYVTRLARNGIVDLTTAERQDIVDVFENDDVDYCVYAEVQPLITKNRASVFSIGKDATVIVPLKVIDLVNGKYLYNGKFSEKARDSSMIGGIGNKSVAKKAINRINKQIESVLKERLPADKSVKIIKK